MAIAWGTENNLDDTLFYNRKKDLEFLTSILNSSQYGSTPTILLTGIRGVGKTALMNNLKNDFKDEYLVIYMDLSISDKYQKGKFTREAFMELALSYFILIEYIFCIHRYVSSIEYY